jgi:hypothetical protein
VTVSKAKFLLVAAVLFLSACAKPAADTNQSASAGSSEPPQIASTDVVKANPQELTLAKGESGYAVVHLLIQNGYHINANPPSFPESHRTGTHASERTLGRIRFVS